MFQAQRTVVLLKLVINEVSFLLSHLLTSELEAMISTEVHFTLNFATPKSLS